MNIETVMLNNGILMPQIGFGTWQMNNTEAEEAVATALELGYRSIDTAAAYGNERGVGRAIQVSNLKREDLFITTKLHDMEGYEHALQQCETSLERLALGYIDLYLIHWPFDDIFSETWRALEKLYADKRVRAIGVSNFSIKRLQALLATAKVVPAVNQVELHPYLNQKPLRDFCQQHRIQIECWSPLMQGGTLLTQSHIVTIAKTHGKTPAQIILRWHVQQGLIAIPKSTSPEHMQQNLHVFDFALVEDEMELISNLNQDRRANPVADPDTFVFTPEIYRHLQHIND